MSEQKHRREAQERWENDFLDTNERTFKEREVDNKDLPEDETEP